MVSSAISVAYYNVTPGKMPTKRWVRVRARVLGLAFTYVLGYGRGTAS